MYRLAATSKEGDNSDFISGKSTTTKEKEMRIIRYKKTAEIV